MNLAKVQTNYAERENIKTIKEKDQVIELRQALIERQRAQYVFIVAITLLVLVLGLVLLIANRRQQRASAELADAKVKIEEQNRMLAVQNKELDARVKLRTSELSKSNKMLTEVNSELDNFLYKTSHDIRGPLVTLKGLCNLALIEAKEPSLRDILDKLDGQSDKMAKILNRLTAVGKVNQSNLAPVKINFKSILDGILKSEEANSLPKNVKVTYEVGSNVSMISDAELVTNILENLIDNGIKFYNNSSRVDPFVHVVVKQESNHVMVKVEDNGIGILNAKPDEVFHMFMRASERSDTGGVGLYLSKICTDKLGGEIKLDQTSKDGSTFVIQFPLDLSAILAQRKIQEETLEKQRELEGELENKSKVTTST
jgi:signal transduction histidine kinase